eukprot:CAMPEP_0181350688 /NCGR_PEP_ID=MMETSP1106-20121128/1394_1 /TAXON_ID=81844 /ORGANISM="Mantoniella antarctica, Strain SL-175" /LENGTH=249 /DNA_ID=CAMNT_0023463167 /DNA_START=399 /DNA_END=1144 /DNA_ORIENTATION=+
MRTWGANKDVVPLNAARFKTQPLPEVIDFEALHPEVESDDAQDGSGALESRAGSPRPGQEQFHRFYFPFERRASDDAGVPGGAPFRPFFGHFDVFCDWDQERGHLRSDMSSPNARMAGYSRLNYARSIGQPTGGAEGLQWQSEDMSATPHTAPVRPDTSQSHLSAASSMTSLRYSGNGDVRRPSTSAGGYDARARSLSSAGSAGGYATRPSTSSGVVGSGDGSGNGGSSGDGGTHGSSFYTSRGAGRPG